MELGAQLTLFFRAEGLPDKDITSKSDPYLVLKEVGKGRTFVGRTETINNNLNPHWKQGIRVCFVFETKQDFSIEVYDDDGSSQDEKNEQLISVGFQLAQVVGSKGHTLKLTAGATRVFVTAVEDAANAKDVVAFSFAGSELKNMDTLSKSDPFFVLFRLLPSGARTELFKSKTIDDTLDPQWPETLQFTLGELCGPKPDDKSLLLEVWDEDVTSNDLIGAARFSFNELARSFEKQPAGQQQHALHLVPTTDEAMNGLGAGHCHGYVRVREWKLIHRPTFVEFLRSGLQINLAVSVDFTGSNGVPSNPRSLHYWNPQVPNQYASAVMAVGEILMQYDTDKMVAAFGFGAVLPTNVTSHFFHLNLQDNPYVQNVGGVLQAYQYALTHVTLSGPTNFAPTITALSRGANATQNVYTVLLIITDGEITDMQDTIDAIVDAERSPISIIIVGVGENAFSAMDQLDADREPLRHSSGATCRRDLVQFVPFRNFNGRPAELASEVLREVPAQVEAWATLTGYHSPV